ncbi:MAG: endonuclease/exonuclease/phosphatase family protein [Octadecabacter sp.]|nr:endonuclease/exonuclease/phosphatase family protein [Octadecabacter sp.]
MRIATFNLQNLRLRRRQGQLVLDGAADHDFHDRPRSIEQDIADRELTAKVIASAQADIVALQEVFDDKTLDFFCDHFLVPAGAPNYPSRTCWPGNDGRGLDVAVLAKTKPLKVKSHAHLTGADFGLDELPDDLRDRPLFRRDCLQVDFESFTLFVCHFKAPYPETEKAYVVREAEARAVRKIVEARFPEPETERWIILGDFNEPAMSNAHEQSALWPLRHGFAEGLLDRMAGGTDWTYEVPDTHVRSRPDRIFLSPKLAMEYSDAIPQVVRTGMSRSLADTKEAGCAVGPFSRASDHALVYVDLPDL